MAVELLRDRLRLSFFSPISGMPRANLQRMSARRGPQKAGPSPTASASLARVHAAVLQRRKAESAASAASAPTTGGAFGSGLGEGLGEGLPSLEALGVRNALDTEIKYAHFNPDAEYKWVELDTSSLSDNWVKKGFYEMAVYGYNVPRPSDNGFSYCILGIATLSEDTTARADIGIAGKVYCGTIYVHAFVRVRDEETARDLFACVDTGLRKSYHGPSVDMHYKAACSVYLKSLRRTAVNDTDIREVFRLVNTLLTELRDGWQVLDIWPLLVMEEDGEEKAKAEAEEQRLATDKAPQEEMTEKGEENEEKKRGIVTAEEAQRMAIQMTSVDSITSYIEKGDAYYRAISTLNEMSQTVPNIEDEEWYKAVSLAIKFAGKVRTALKEAKFVSDTIAEQYGLLAKDADKAKDIFRRRALAFNKKTIDFEKVKRKVLVPASDADVDLITTENSTQMEAYQRSIEEKLEVLERQVMQYNQTLKEANAFAKANKLVEARRVLNDAVNLFMQENARIPPEVTKILQNMVVKESIYSLIDSTSKVKEAQTILQRLVENNPELEKYDLYKTARGSVDFIAFGSTYLERISIDYRSLTTSFEGLSEAAAVLKDSMFIDFLNRSIPNIRLEDPPPLPEEYNTKSMQKYQKRLSDKKQALLGFYEKYRQAVQSALTYVENGDVPSARRVLITARLADTTTNERVNEYINGDGLDEAKRFLGGLLTTEVDDLNVNQNAAYPPAREVVTYIDNVREYIRQGTEHVEEVQQIRNALQGINGLADDDFVTNLMSFRDRLEAINLRIMRSAPERLMVAGLGQAAKRTLQRLMRRVYKIGQKNDEANAWVGLAMGQIDNVTSDSTENAIKGARNFITSSISIPLADAGQLSRDDSSQDEREDDKRSVGGGSL